MSQEKQPKAKPSEETASYRLKPGAKFHDVNQRDEQNRPVRLEPGTVVQLTAPQAEAFRDQFEKV